MLKAKHYVCVRGDMYRPGAIIDQALNAEEEARLISKGAAEYAEDTPEAAEAEEAQGAPEIEAAEEEAKEPEHAAEEAEEAGEFELKIDAAEAVGKRKGRRGK